jgi:glycosyltransferase involved in cell wall biosynthesis
MRILLLSQYFDPEPLPIGIMFARELVRQGHEVEVLTGFPNYPGGKVYPGYRLRFIQREMVEGIRITRVPLFPSHDSAALHRIFNYLSFALVAAVMGPWVVQKPDVIYAYHGNATIGLPAWVIGAVLRAPFVLDVQDLWPDAITASGILPSRLEFLVPVLETWCQFVYRWAAQIGVQSPGFKQTLLARGVPEAKLQFIPNWCDEVQARPGPLAPEEESLLAGQFNVVVAGSMGTAQGLEVVLQAALLLAGTEPQVQFVLVGGGVERPHLEALALSLGLRNVIFLPRRPVEAIGALLHRADALLVHLKDDPLFAITIPSRIQAYLAVGRPILCGVRGNGSELVQQAEAGLCFEPDSPTALAEAITALCHMPAQARVKMGDRGRKFYQDKLSVPVGTAAFIELFEQARHV